MIIKTQATLHFDRETALRLLNKYHIGSEFCSFVNENGDMVLKDHENMNDLKQAQSNLCLNIVVPVSAELTHDGKLQKFKIIKE